MKHLFFILIYILFLEKANCQSFDSTFIRYNYGFLKDEFCKNSYKCNSVLNILNNTHETDTSKSVLADIHTFFNGVYSQDLSVSKIEDYRIDNIDAWFSDKRSLYILKFDNDSIWNSHKNQIIADYKDSMPTYFYFGIGNMLVAFPYNTIIFYNGFGYCYDMEFATESVNSFIQSLTDKRFLGDSKLIAVSFIYYSNIKRFTLIDVPFGREWYK